MRTMPASVSKPFKNFSIDRSCVSDCDIRVLYLEDYQHKSICQKWNEFQKFMPKINENVEKNLRTTTGIFVVLKSNQKQLNFLSATLWRKQLVIGI